MQVNTVWPDWQPGNTVLPLPKTSMVKGYNYVNAKYAQALGADRAGPCVCAKVARLRAALSAAVAALSASDASTDGDGDAAGAPGAWSDVTARSAPSA